MAVDASSIGNQAQVVFFGRSHDSTPIRVAFGQLGDLASAARYWHKDKITGSSSLLTLDEYSSIYTKLPSFGIVEMLAQKGVVAWPVEQDGDFIAVERRIFPPTNFFRQVQCQHYLQSFECGLSTHCSPENHRDVHHSHGVYRHLHRL
jgi:hypothetical protein